MNEIVELSLPGNIADKACHSIFDLSDEQVKALGQFFDLQERSLAPNTLRGLKTDLGFFLEFCRDNGLVALPCSLDTIKAFIKHRADSDVKGATISRNLSAISKLHDAINAPNACRSAIVRDELRAVKRARPQRKKQATPIRFSALWEWDKYIRESDALADIRDRAMMWCFYDCLLRGDELHRAEVSWVEYLDDGDAIFHIPTHKGDQEGEGSEAYLSPHTVSALKRWLESASITTGRLFRSFTVEGEIRSSISANGIRRIISNRGFEMGILGASNHSFRVGATQDLVEAGESSARIQLAGRWKSDRMVGEYSRNQRAKTGAMAELSKRQGRS